MKPIVVVLIGMGGGVLAEVIAGGSPSTRGQSPGYIVGMVVGWIVTLMASHDSRTGHHTKLEVRPDA